MRQGAKDFRSGQGYDMTVFFDESVDIHHIFPQAWCEAQKIDVKIFDTVINKTPLSYRTNRIIGGVAPSKYLAKLEQGKNTAAGQVEYPPIAAATLDDYLKSHCISPAHLRADDFAGFMKERRKALLALISSATGHNIADAADAPEEGEDISDEVARDSGVATATP
jgi:hypothetical protein